MEIELPAPLAGYAWPRPAAMGYRRPLFARATALQMGKVKVALLSLELLLVPESLAEAIRAGARQLGFDDAVVTATHTHSSVGGYDRRLLFQLAATRRFDPQIERAIVDAALSAITEAQAQIRPAKLAWGEGVFPELAVARSDGPPPTGRLSLLRIDGPDGPIAQWVLLGAHPTTVPKGAERLDGDFPGALAAKLEQEDGGTTLIFQSGGGNASAATFDAKPEEKAERIADAVSQDLQKLAVQPVTGPLFFARARLGLPHADVRRLVSGLWVGPANNLLSCSAPRELELSLLALGTRTFLLLPAEPSAGAAAPLEATALNLRSISLADGYVGYVEPRPLVESGQGEARRQYFDASLLSKLEQGAQVLVHARGKELEGEAGADHP